MKFKLILENKKDIKLNQQTLKQISIVLESIKFVQDFQVIFDHAEIEVNVDATYTEKKYKEFFNSFKLVKEVKLTK